MQTLFYSFILSLSMLLSPHKSITLEKDQWKALPETRFFHATTGKTSDAPTKVRLKADEDFLHIDFDCEKDPFVEQNHYTQHNGPLFKQEVFEVFIAAGTADPAQYLELEINPKNALWIGKISNPTLGEGGGVQADMVAHETSGVRHAVRKGAEAWSGTLSIPWQLVGAKREKYYRVNFYRIVSRKSQAKTDWACTPKNCDFLCWNATMSGDAPAFHRPKRFGGLDIGF